MVVWLLFAGSYIECHIIWSLKFVVKLVYHIDERVKVYICIFQQSSNSQLKKSAKTQSI